MGFFVRKRMPQFFIYGYFPSHQKFQDGIYRGRPVYIGFYKHMKFSEWSHHIMNLLIIWVLYRWKMDLFYSSKRTNATWLFHSHIHVYYIIYVQFFFPSRIFSMMTVVVLFIMFTIRWWSFNMMPLMPILNFVHVNHRRCWCILYFCMMIVKKFVVHHGTPFEDLTSDVDKGGCT